MDNYSDTLRSVCRKAVILVLGLSLGINIAALALPLYTLQIFDRVLTSSSKETLAMLAIALAVMGVLFISFDALRRRVPALLAGEIQLRLSGPLFHSSMQESLNSLSDKENPHWQGVERLSRLLLNPGLLVAVDAIWSPLFILVLFLLHPAFGWLMLGGNLLLLVIAVWQVWTVREAQEDYLEQRTKIQAVHEQAWRHAPVIKAMGMLDDWLKRTEIERANLNEKHQCQSIKSNRFVTLTTTIKWLLQAALPTVGALLLLSSNITPGAMLAALIIGFRSLMPFEALVTQGTVFKKLVEELGNINKALKRLAQVELVTPPGELEGVVHLCQLSVLDDDNGQSKLLDGIDLSVKPGEMLAIIGPNGAGKSLLLETALGLHEASEGVICYDDSQFKAWDPSWLGQHIGYVPQNIALLPGCIRDVICRHQTIDDTLMLEAAQTAAVHSNIMALPHGYDTQIGINQRALPFGFAQRIALARALYCYPQLLFFDEADSALDVKGVANYIELLNNARRTGKTLLVTTQRRSVLNVADKVLVLNRGRVCYSGTYSNFANALTGDVKDRGDTTRVRVTEERKAS